MAHRTLAGLVAGAALLACAAPAHATLVYVRHAASAHPQVWAARDGGGRARRVVRARTVGEVEFAPDGTRMGVVLPRRLAIYDPATRREVAAVRGRIRGFAFGPDSRRVVYGKARSNAFDARVDLYATVLEPPTPIPGGPTGRLTTDGRSLNPVWGADFTIVFDRMTRRRGDAPAYQLWASTISGGGGARQITHMRVPPLLSGLVPLELSADGTRLLAEFVGQDTSAGFTVDMRTGRVRALSRRLENGFVAADLSADGRTVLGSTGGPDPVGGHDVVTVPFRGGRATVLVRGAAEPRWTR
jgi:hypothetical protein